MVLWKTLLYGLIAFLLFISVQMLLIWDPISIIYALFAWLTVGLLIINEIQQRRKRKEKPPSSPAGSIYDDILDN